MQVFLCVAETILVHFYFVVWVLLSFQSFVICHLAMHPSKILKETTRIPHYSCTVQKEYGV